MQDTHSEIEQDLYPLAKRFCTRFAGLETSHGIYNGITETGSKVDPNVKTIFGPQ